MMFSCSVASQLSVGAFLHINTFVILLGDVNQGQSVVGSSRNGGV